MKWHKFVLGIKVKQCKTTAVKKALVY